MSSPLTASLLTAEQEKSWLQFLKAWSKFEDLFNDPQTRKAILERMPHKHDWQIMRVLSMSYNNPGEYTFELGCLCGVIKFQSPVVDITSHESKGTQ